ncbi:cytochrome oxidase assembly protein [Rufibacter radiotolerans]|uniref:Cytochrome oxidase assembly protein n=1 Tax=Rufibacter radiotolerans TaxID=1379910 RepID=A0A0H4VJY1_9BACT|nr:COX15/CtaA family protein [Rufibacter radiotolerans]AKQ46090.1 cytochrome oxidase assembly protein [Rufibacter radiotolerans]
MGSKSFSTKRFRRVGVLTIASVYFLILVGGIVRSTGSGMGCPDWPKCFGSWVPPTSLSQLPPDYLEVYKEKRIQKNERIGQLLQNLGFTRVAKEIFAHPSQYIETEFNATKTWIEYVNRLVGVLIGFLIFLTVLYAIPFFKSDPKVFWGALLSFLLVAFQGWLGSLVVSTNLLPEMVTLHMALALVLLALLIYIVERVHREQLWANVQAPSGNVKGLIATVLVLTFLQVILGTQVREEVDMVSFNLNNLGRESWIDQLGLSFYVHRSASILVVLLNVVLFYAVKKTGNQRLLCITKGVLGVIVIEILLGIILSYLALPAFAQPLHLVFGTILFGLQFWLLITYYYTYKPYQASPELVA